MRDPNDWRLTNQERYLKGVSLTWSQYSPARRTNDHDHCKFCWSKFMEQPMPNALQAGYSTPDREHWVCKTCFDDFVDLFEWKVAGAG